MALKADREELQTDMSFFYNAGTATRGGAVCHNGAGSGSAMDQSAALVEYTTDPNTRTVVGILLNDVVNLDLTRQHINWHKDEVQKGGKVTLLRRGWCVTNSIDSVTIAASDVAYLSSGTAGNLTNVVPTTANIGPLTVGRFLSTLDEDGYAKVEVGMPAPADMAT